MKAGKRIPLVQRAAWLLVSPAMRCAIAAGIALALLACAHQLDGGIR